MCELVPNTYFLIIRKRFENAKNNAEHHAQASGWNGISTNAVGQQWVQQVQLTSTQSAIKYSRVWSELQNGTVPTNKLSDSNNAVRAVKETNVEGMVPDSCTTAT
jgi:hypothetical protein